MDENGYGWIDNLWFVLEFDIELKGVWVTSPW